MSQPYRLLPISSYKTACLIVSFPSFSASPSVLIGDQRRRCRQCLFGVFTHLAPHHLVLSAAGCRCAPSPPSPSIPPSLGAVVSPLLLLFRLLSSTVFLLHYFCLVRLLITAPITTTGRLSSAVSVVPHLSLVATSLHWHHHSLRRRLPGSIHTPNSSKDEAPKPGFALLHLAPVRLHAGGPLSVGLSPAGRPLPRHHRPAAPAAARAHPSGHRSAADAARHRPH